jgi:hypothetical protein
MASPAKCRGHRRRSRDPPPKFGAVSPISARHPYDECSACGIQPANEERLNCRNYAGPDHCLHARIYPRSILRRGWSRAPKSLANGRKNVGRRLTCWRSKCRASTENNADPTKVQIARLKPMVLGQSNFLFRGFERDNDAKADGCLECPSNLTVAPQCTDRYTTSLSKSRSGNWPQAIVYCLM